MRIASARSISSASRTLFSKTVASSPSYGKQSWMLSFVRSVLQPESVGETRVRAKETKRYDMQYRYDHTLRVADIGGEIARSEGLSEEALVMVNIGNLGI